MIQDPRRCQQKGAATRTRRTVTVTLPRVLAEIASRVSAGRPVTLAACKDIPGYHAILHRFTHHEILEMVKCSA